MSLDLVLIIVNLVLAVACVFLSIRIMRSMGSAAVGGSWKFLVGGLAVFAFTSLYRVAEGVAPMLGTEFEIAGLDEISELVYICLFLVGIFMQVLTYRKLSKA